MVDFLAVRYSLDTSSSQIPAPRTSESSNSDEDNEAQLGRPSKWTPTRRRKALRLYLFSKLSTEEIASAVQEEDWMPGDESTKKIVSSLLNKQPRWLRPKNKEQADQRLTGLSESKTRRNAKRMLVSHHKSQQPQPESPKSTFVAAHPPAADLTDALSNLKSDNLGEGSAPGIPAHQDGQHIQAAWDLKALFPEEYFDLCDPPLPTIGEDTETLASDQHTLSTYWSTSSIKRRLPNYSSKELKTIVKLMKAHSISNSSAATINSATSTITPTRTAKYNCSSFLSRANTVIDETPDPLLADSLVVADWHKESQGFCSSGLPSHDLKSCWCAVIEDLQSNCQTWLDPAWRVDVKNIAQTLFDLNLLLKDEFGNTALHFLAARGAGISVVINAIEHGGDPNARNTANQTFLHLFPGGFLHELAHQPHELDYSLQKLKALGVRMYECDHFGRTPFHSTSSETVALYPHSIWRIARQIEWPSSRDAFGHIPALDFSFADGSNPGKRPQFHQEDVCSVDGAYSGGKPPPVIRSGLHPAKMIPANVHVGYPKVTPLVMQSTLLSKPWLEKQTALLKTAQLAFDTPKIEDREGRNGLQCLAETSLAMMVGEGTIQPMGNRKRKRSSSDPPQPSASRLTLRYQMVQNMIDAKLDINHFDKKGSTVLMAFVTHLPDGEDDKILRMILAYLIQKGANIHLRNRRGETALHIAVRLGRKVATTTLLQNGANVHARTTDGKGVLAVAEKAYFEAKDIEFQQLYASIMACQALAFQYGAVPAPTIVQEWSEKQGFATYLRLQNTLTMRQKKVASRNRKRTSLNDQDEHPEMAFSRPSS